MGPTTNALHYHAHRAYCKSAPVCLTAFV